MLGSNEPSFADVDELLKSWINTSAPEPSSNATVPKARESAVRNQAPPRVSGLLQGTYTRDINPSLQNTTIAEARYIDHASSAAAVAKAGDQATTSGSKTLDPEGDLNTRRGKHSCQAASEPATRNSEVNRRAQKKFRQRQKERFEDMQTRLKDTASELEKKDEMIAQLRSTQQQLQRRNVVLESLYKTGSLPLSSSSAPSSSPNPTASDPSPSPSQTAHLSQPPSHRRSPPVAVAPVPGDVASFPATLGILNRQYIAQEIGDSGFITLSLLGGVGQMSMTDLGNMPVPDFAKLYTAYIRNLAPALTAPRRDPSARGFTRQMAKELGHLVECVKLVNMDCFHAMVKGKMHPAMARKVKMDEAFYDRLTRNLTLSKEQQEDITYLRRLYFTRRAVLAEKRKGLEAMLASANSNLRNVPLPKDRLSELSGIQAQVQQVAEEDCRVYFRTMTAIRRKILTPDQFALICVHSYPYITSGEQWMCAWKSEPSLESKEMIVAAAAVFDMKSEWEALETILAETPPEGPAPTCLSKQISGKQLPSAPPLESAAAAAAAQPTDSSPTFALQDNPHPTAIQLRRPHGTHETSWASADPCALPAGTSHSREPPWQQGGWPAAAAHPSLPRSPPTRMDQNVSFSSTAQPSAEPSGSNPFSAHPPSWPAATMVSAPLGNNLFQAHQAAWPAASMDSSLAVSNPLDGDQSTWAPALSNPSLLSDSTERSHRWHAAATSTHLPNNSLHALPQHSWTPESHATLQATDSLRGSADNSWAASSGAAAPNADLPSNSLHAMPQHSWAARSHAVLQGVDDLHGSVENPWISNPSAEAVTRHRFGNTDQDCWAHAAAVAANSEHIITNLDPWTSNAHTSAVAAENVDQFWSGAVPAPDRPLDQHQSSWLSHDQDAIVSPSHGHMQSSIVPPVPGSFDAIIRSDAHHPLQANPSRGASQHDSKRHRQNGLSLY